MTNPPTIGETKALGIKGFSITCLTPGCHHPGRSTFEALGLPDDTIFIHIGRAGRLVCSKCGGKRIEVMPDWRDHVARGERAAMRAGLGASTIRNILEGRSRSPGIDTISALAPVLNVPTSWFMEAD